MDGHGSGDLKASIDCWSLDTSRAAVHLCCLQSGCAEHDRTIFGAGVAAGACAKTRAVSDQVCAAAERPGGGNCWSRRLRCRVSTRAPIS